jgi:hypothetical protein
MQMNGWNRVVAALLAAGVGGFLLWLAAQFDMRTTGGYWAALGIVAGCGLLLGAAKLRGAGGNPPAMLLVGFLPVLICAGWVIVEAQPRGNWFDDHVTAWSSDMGILHVVRDLATFNGVLAFGIGLVLAYALEPAVLARRRTVVATEAPPVGRRRFPIDRTAADEPTLAEREEAGAGTSTRTIERTDTVVR